jgi:hypothetical protein
MAIAGSVQSGLPASTKIAGATKETASRATAGTSCWTEQGGTDLNRLTDHRRRD